HVLEDWQKREYTGLKLGVGRMKKFLALVGNPQKSFSAIHIAGTNGKGSTACMIASILSTAGYTTGLYTSPHLVELRDRICVNDKPISQRALKQLVDRYEGDAQQCRLTFFEFITGIAFIYYARCGIDVAVIETGLGGRFDATNVIADPVVCVISEIGYDHQQFLGHRLTDIAREKAGIIKKGSSVVTGVTDAGAYRVIRQAARQKKIPVYRFATDFNGCSLRTDWAKGLQKMVFHPGTAPVFSPSTDITVDIPFVGGHQIRNACLAVTTVSVLKDKGWDISREHIRTGLSRARWPGRFDIRRCTRRGRVHTMVIDGAHNPQAVAAFVRSWCQSPWGNNRQPFIFGVLKDKDYRAIIRLVAPLMSEVVLVTVSSNRALEAQEMAVLFKKYRAIKRIATAASVEEALEMMNHKPVVAVVGSLYLAGEVIKKWEVK
ncbi:MAG: folylpolyglutamate synthase/dihydrofolate synthase family protein, partial [Endomicrobiales bacterium]